MYVDENALQPGQEQTTWDWHDVHYADNISSALEEYARANDTAGRLAYLRTELEGMGLEVHEQPELLDPARAPTSLPSRLRDWLASRSLEPSERQAIAVARAPGFGGRPRIAPTPKQPSRMP